MANHKSAKKRSIQSIKKTKINRILSSKIGTTFYQLNNNIIEKNIEAAQESLRLYNSSLSKALKRGILKKNNISRKLSSLSNKLKKIA